MHFKKLILLFFSDLGDLIRSDAFLARHRRGNASFTRSRKLSFADIVLFLLRLPQKTLSSEMTDFVKDCLPQKEGMSISKQALCMARQKISPAAFKELLYFTYHRLHILPRSSTYWHGHAVKAIDGTTFRIPNTPENRGRFQTQRNQYGEVPLIKASTLYNVSEDLIEDVVLGNCRDSEKSQAMEMLTDAALHDGSGLRPIVTFDRGYPSGELIHHITNRNGLFLMRCSSSTFKNVLACPQGDSETTIVYKKQKIRLRVLRFTLESGMEEILITNVFDSRLGIEDFRERYALRWKTELKNGEIKQQLKTENFAGKKPDNILQEVYAALAFSNLASVLKFMVDKAIGADTEGKGNKHEYQANRNFLIGELKEEIHLLLGNAFEADVALHRLLFLAQKIRSPIRANRKKERVWHKYSKTHTYCMNQRTAL